VGEFPPEDSGDEESPGELVAGDEVWPGAGAAAELRSAAVRDGKGAVSGGQDAAPAGRGAARPESAGAAQYGRAFFRGEVIAGFQQAGQQFGLGGEGAE
jgi:hypothetical protein